MPFIDLSETDLLNREDVLGFALESIFFDARDRAVDDTFIRHAAQYASDLNLMHDYVDLKFMPSTCFATNRSKWLSFREIRGGKTGARDLAFFCKEHGIGAIFPVIARAVDVGMLHPDGYSVATRGGVDKVEEVKNTYLTSDSFPSKRGLPRMFSGNRDDLFRKSVRLDGF
jgi:hypothetical protein